MSNKKPSIENRKDRTAKKLSVRLESLKTKGMTDVQIKRDPKVRQIQAEIRKAKKQLANIAKNENLIAQMTETKAQKLAAPKTDKPKQKKSDKAPAEKKAKKKQK